PLESSRQSIAFSIGASLTTFKTNVPKQSAKKNIHKTPCGNSAIEELTAVWLGRIALQATLEFKEARLRVLRAPI
ncbi:hypothetical protein AB1A64_20210, partial [Ruegeria sp. ANG10]|uniref:hypothetical protein n=1 Tax=Ruegeria sp. ANG10 TaxID=3042467 RepID=UPI00345437E8